MSLIPRSFFRNDLFDDFLEDMPRKMSDMKCDIYEKDGMYHIEMDLAGANKDDIVIDYDDGYLSISVKKEQKIDEGKRNYIHKERHFGRYERRLYVGSIDENSIKAEFKDGVLNVVFPKEAPTEKKKTIEIE